MQVRRISLDRNKHRHNFWLITDFMSLELSLSLSVTGHHVLQSVIPSLIQLVGLRVCVCLNVMQQSCQCSLGIHSQELSMQKPCGLIAN